MINLLPKIISNISQAIKKAEGRALLVGGSVRDMLLEKEIKDFDIEVFNLPAEEIQKVLEQFGEVKFVGEQFSVFKLWKSDFHIDISLPRRDIKTAPGHGGFEVITDPEMSYQDATRRRDFTINAVMYDPITKEMIDLFDGKKDLKNRILRVMDEKTFGDDPLRVLRAMQFVARFELEVEPRSLEIIIKTAPRIKELSSERFLEEWRKLLMKAQKPSLGLQAGMDFGVFEILWPQFVDLVKTEQESLWHPEGNVWNHTKMAVDKAVEITKNQSPEVQWLIRLSALCHDLGKPAVTKIEDGRIRSRDHSKAGIEPAKDFLNSINVDKSTARKVLKLVAEHMAPMMLHWSNLKNTVSDAAIYRLARRLAPVSIYELILQRTADTLGAGPYTEFSKKHEEEGLQVDEKGFPLNAPECDWLKERAEELNVLQDPPKDIITGKDLIELGFEPGPRFDKLIDKANQMYEDQGMSKQEILKLLGSDPDKTDPDKIKNG